jgi:membrane protease YdiL (CAAX protease family)
MPKKEIALKNSALLAAYLLIVWGFYRFLFKFPEEIEELLIKPVIWLLPVLYFVRKEQKGLASLGITLNNLFPSIYLSLFLGILFAVEGVFVNFIKYKGVDFGANIGQIPFWGALGISMATAISEEVAFRGFLFNRVWHAIGSEWRANILTSMVWAIVHVPVAVFWWELNLGATLGFLILTTIFAIGSAFVFARTRNVFSSILLHVLWEWPIILFR